MASTVEVIDYNYRTLRITYAPDVGDVLNVDILKGCFTMRELDSENVEIVYYDYTNSNSRQRTIVNYTEVTSRSLSDITALVNYLTEFNGEIAFKYYYPQFMFIQ